MRNQVFAEALDLLGLLPEIARGTKRGFERFLGRGKHRAHIEKALALKILDGLLDIRPRRVLRQDRADGNLERRIARPPVAQ